MFNGTGARITIATTTFSSNVAVGGSGGPGGFAGIGETGGSAPGKDGLAGKGGTGGAGGAAVQLLVAVCSMRPGTIQRFHINVLVQHRSWVVKAAKRGQATAVTAVPAANSAATPRNGGAWCGRRRGPGRRVRIRRRRGPV